MNLCQNVHNHCWLISKEAWNDKQAGILNMPPKKPKSTTGYVNSVDWNGGMEW